MAQKRRSAALGLIAGLLLGPLAVLLALASGRANMMRCPNCRENIDRDARVCPHCRTALGRDGVLGAAEADVVEAILAAEEANGRVRGTLPAALYAKPDLGQQTPLGLVRAGAFLDVGDARGAFRQVSTGVAKGWMRTEAIELGHFTTPAPTTKVCPQCAEQVQAAAQICRFCHYDFGASSPRTR